MLKNHLTGNRTRKSKNLPSGYVTGHVFEPSNPFHVVTTHFPQMSSPRGEKTSWESEKEMERILKDAFTWLFLNYYKTALILPAGQISIDAVA